MLKLNLILCAVYLLFYAGCSTSPELISSWRDPNSTIYFDSLHKVLVVAALNDSYNRKFTENRLAARLGNAGVKSYEYFELADLVDKKYDLIKKFKEENFNGAIVVSVVPQQTEIKAQQTIPTFYLDYWDFTEFYVNSRMNTGRMSHDEFYRIEVNVYSFKTNKLVWSCVASWTNPEFNMERLVNNIVNLVADKMDEENFIIR